MTRQEVQSSAKLFLINRYYDEEDIEEDIVRIRHIKKLVSRLKAGKPNYRLIVNHLIILFNVFEPSYVTQALRASVKECDWVIINTFLIFLRRSLDVVHLDRELLEQIKKDI